MSGGRREVLLKAVLSRARGDCYGEADGDQGVGEACCRCRRWWSDFCAVGEAPACAAKGHGRGQSSVDAAGDLSTDSDATRSFIWAAMASRLDPTLVERIEKLAGYVAQGNESMEATVRERQRTNPQFAFLFGGEGADFYQECVRKFSQPKIGGSVDQSLIVHPLRRVSQSQYV